MGYWIVEAPNATAMVQYSCDSVELCARCANCEEDYSVEIPLIDFFNELGITAEDCQKAFEDGEE